MTSSRGVAGMVNGDSNVEKNDVAAAMAEPTLQTRVVKVGTDDLGYFEIGTVLQTWRLSSSSGLLQASGVPSELTNLGSLQQAAKLLRESNIPVGFPTETVYGLGADATRSEAVKGIYKAKGRPSDNPLIIHVCDLNMLHELMLPADQPIIPEHDPVPAIYKSLIHKFWPGPLTILLPNPSPSRLAPEVTAGLPTFGVRMPNSTLALSLIRLAGVPLAAPSANASTKPSPTTAAHVLHDLNGKIELILDGGPCNVGVESTVVDALCNPPVVLRPGGISIDAIRQCPGWENVTKGYKDQSEIGASAPRAPGMKYKHYSPRAKVVLYESASKRDTQIRRDSNAGIPMEAWRIITAKEKKLAHLGFEFAEYPVKIGLISTKYWSRWAGFDMAKWSHFELGAEVITEVITQNDATTTTAQAKRRASSRRAEVNGPSPVEEDQIHPEIGFKLQTGELWQRRSVGVQNRSAENGITGLSREALGLDGSASDPDQDSEPNIPELIAELIEISLGSKTEEIARGLFSALRELDVRGVSIIYVEGIEDDGEGTIAAAVMNRLRKAATVIEK